MDLLCLAYDCDPPGKFSGPAGPLTVDELVSIVGGDNAVARGAIAELQRNGILKHEDGCFYSKRMLKDCRDRELEATAAANRRKNQAIVGPNVGPNVGGIVGPIVSTDSDSESESYSEDKKQTQNHQNGAVAPVVDVGSRGFGKKESERIIRAWNEHRSGIAGRAAPNDTKLLSRDFHDIRERAHVPDAAKLDPIGFIEAQVVAYLESKTGKGPYCKRSLFNFLKDQTWLGTAEAWNDPGESVNTQPMTGEEMVARAMRSEEP